MNISSGSSAGSGRQAYLRTKRDAVRRRKQLVVLVDVQHVFELGDRPVAAETFHLVGVHRVFRTQAGELRPMQIVLKQPAIDPG